MSVRVKFLEALSDSLESSSVPYSDRSYLFQEVAILTDAEITQWIQLVDESTYGLGEWLEALVFFQSWLKSKQKGKNFLDQIEYISCCIQGSSNSGRLLTLEDLLKSYLETFGVR
jgi:hypothetical protein